MPGLTGDEFPFALAFGAGLVASVNPCGFAILPSLLFYYLGRGSAGRGALGRIADGLVVGLVLSAGFMLVFGLAGLVLAAGMRAMVQVVPWMALAMGLAFVLLGALLLAGGHVTVRMPVVELGQGAGYRSLFLFGVGYAVGSLSCTLPVFLLVVGAGLAAGSVAGMVAVFLAYGLGMSTVLMLLCLGTAGFRELVVRRVRGLYPHVGRISGGLLLLGGGYILYYWASLLRGDTESLAIRLVQDLQRWAQGAVLLVGERVWLLLAVGLAAAALLTLAVRVIREEQPREPREPGRSWPEVEKEGLTEGAVSDGQ